MPCCAIAAFIAAQLLAFSQRLRARLFGVIPGFAARPLPTISRRLMAVVLAAEIGLVGAWLFTHPLDPSAPVASSAFCLAGGR